MPKRCLASLDGLLRAALPLVFGLLPLLGWAAPPGNDNFASRVGIFTSETLSGTNVEATKEAGEPVPAGFAAGNYDATIWYEWTPDFGGWYEVNTVGSSVDTILSVWTGTTLASLQQVHVNDEADSGSVSRVRFSASGGTTYFFCIAGKAGQTRGATALSIFFIPDPLVTSVPAISFSPSPVNVTSAAGTLTVDVTMQANATPDLGWFRLYDPANSRFVETSLSVSNRISGNNLSGVYRVQLTVPERAQPGLYRWGLRVQNTAGTKVGSYGWEEMIRSAPLVQTVTVQNTGAVDTFLHWQKLHQLAGAGSGREEDFDLDAVANLLEFAFAMDPRMSARGRVETSGSAILKLGLPDVSVVGAGDQRRLKITFVRRVSDASGMSYQGVFGDSPDSLSAGANTPNIVATDGVHEVVSIEDEVFVPARSKRFGTVKVTYPLP